MHGILRRNVLEKQPKRGKFQSCLFFDHDLRRKRRLWRIHRLFPEPFHRKSTTNLMKRNENVQITTIMALADAITDTASYRRWYRAFVCIYSTGVCIYIYIYYISEYIGKSHQICGSVLPGSRGTFHRLGRASHWTGDPSPPQKPALHHRRGYSRTLP